MRLPGKMRFCPPRGTSGGGPTDTHRQLRLYGAVRYGLWRWTAPSLEVSHLPSHRRKIVSCLSSLLQTLIHVTIRIVNMSPINLKKIFILFCLTAASLAESPSPTPQPALAPRQTDQAQLIGWYSTGS